MIPKNQNRRLLQISILGLMLILGTWGVISALNENAQFFYDPSEVISPDFIAKSEVIKIGGLVVTGTIVKDDGITTEFQMSDFPVEDKPTKTGEVKVSYEGILPDLFAEGDGVVVSGKLVAEDYLVASEVLAKHDENYQPVKK